MSPLESFTSLLAINAAARGRKCHPPRLVDFFPASHTENFAVALEGLVCGSYSALAFLVGALLSQVKCKVPHLHCLPHRFASGVQERSQVRYFAVNDVGKGIVGNAEVGERLRVLVLHVLDCLLQHTRRKGSRKWHTRT